MRSDMWCQSVSQEERVMWLQNEMSKGVVFLKIYTALRHASKAVIQSSEDLYLPKTQYIKRLVCG